MKSSKYDDNFKEEILNECREVGNASIVARRHDISRDTVYGWIKVSKFTAKKERQQIKRN